MPIKIADRVKETSLTQGTGTLTLNGAFGGFQSFSSAIGDGNSTYYAIENESRWEVGIGTYTSSSNTLSRDTVLKSSSGTSKIDISGLAIVFCSYPADKAVIRGEDGLILESGIFTLTRDSAGNFIHMYKDDSNDRTISIYTDGNASPEWRIGVKNSPSSETEAPSYGYMYGKDGQVGLVGNSNNSITLDNTTNFTVKHNNVSLVKASSLTGIHFNTNSASYPAITINGAAAQSQPLTEWTDSAGSVLSVVDKDGNIGIGTDSPDYALDVAGNIGVDQFIYHNGDADTYIRFRGDQLDFVAGGRTMLTLDEATQDIVIVNNGKNDVDFQVEGDGDAHLIRTDAANDRVGIGTDEPAYKLDVVGSGRFTSVIFADATEQSTAYANQEVAVSGWAKSYVDSQDHSGGGGGSAADILANSASGVVISGIANTNSINIASNLVEIRANSASGVVISGIANTNSASISTNVTNIASNLVEVRANSASGVVISGIANTNVTNIASNLVEIRANSASGVVISGIANTAHGWGNHGTQGYSTSDTTYTAGSGLELHGTAFQAAISGANLLATNTPTDNYVPSYDAATGKLTWVANAGGGGGISNVVEDTTPQLGGTLDANSNVIDMGSNNITDAKVGQWDAAAVAIDTSGTYWLDEIRANSASGVVISGIANTNVTNIASNLVEIRANSASGVVISGIANTNVSNIASNLVEIRANSASGVVISGIANTNVSNIASNLVEIRANSASGAAISGWANATFITTDTNTTYTAGSGLELHGTAFQAAISGANLLATNTPSDNQLASYDAATGKFTWVSAGAGGENNEFSFKTISVAGQSDVVADTTTDTLTLAAGSNVTITTNAGTDTITIASTDTTYSVGDGELSQNNFTNDDHTKLNGIETSANNYTLPEASASARGGIELFSDTDQSVAATAVSATASRTYGLQLNSDGQGVVNVPWVDTNTTYSEATTSAEGLMSTAHHDKLDGIEASADVTDATNVTAAGALMDSEVTNLAFVKALAKGISDGNVLTANDAVADDDFLRINGTEVEGLTVAEVLTALNVEAGADVTDATNVTAAGALMDSECAGLAALKATTGTFLSADESKLDGIEAGADVTDTTNVTAAGALMDSEVTNLATVKALAIGISDGNFLTANDVVVDNDFLRIDGTEVEGRSASEVLSDIAAAPAAGSSSVVTVGTVTAGTWQGTAIAQAYIADNAISLAKMAGLARGKIIVGDSNGDPAALAAGSEDYVLTMDSNGDAVWAAAGGGGGGDITGVTLAGDSGTAEDLTANVNLTIAGGNGITTTGSSATLTVAVDAAQPTVTSLGTLTTLTVDNIIINGTTIGHTSDTDAIAIASGGDVTFSQTVTSNGYKMSSSGYTTISGTSHTLAEADDGKVLLFTNGSSITLTVPAGLTVGHSCTVIQQGAGTITFDDDTAATTINNRQSHTKTAGQHARVGLVQYASNVYNLAGDTAT